MISRRYETIVGLFVVGLLAALFLMVLVIAQQEGLWQDRVAYRTIFKNISGLKKGSEVRLSGVTVGSVTDISIGAKGDILVTFEVVRRYQAQIRQDTRASIGFIGLLGDRSLDLSAGSPNLAAVAPGGLIAAVEPLDLTEMLARATPYVERFQKLLDNLVVITEDFVGLKGELKQLFKELRRTAEKLNQGQGTLGLLVNDPTLYRESAKAAAAAGKIMTEVAASRGLLGTLLNDRAFKAEAQKTLKELAAALGQLERGSRPLEESLKKLPTLVKKAEAFLDNLERASQALPELVVEGQGLVSDADKVAQAAQKTWLLRRHLSPAQERTIRLDNEIK